MYKFSHSLNFKSSIITEYQFIMPFKGKYMMSIRYKQVVTVAIISVTMILMGSLVACNKFKSAQTFISEAVQYHQNGDNNSAIIQLKNALQKDPDNSEARYLLGTIYNETGDSQSAEKEIRKALSLGISTEKALPDLIQALLAQGQFQKVLDETKDISSVAANAEILTLRGSAFLALGKNNEAKESLDLALKNDSGYSDAMIGLAKYSIVEKDINSASRYSEQAISANPNNINAWLFKGDLLRSQGKFELSLAAYDQALKLDPNSILARIAKANNEIVTKQFDAAKTDIEAARKTSPKGLIVFYTQALLDFSQGNAAAALDSLQQILRVAPDHMPSVLLAGAVQYALGSMPQAEQYLKKYLENNPDNLYARKMLASTLIKDNHAQYAIDVLSPVLIDGQQDPQLFALAGEMYTQTGDYTKASEYFAKASALVPKSPELHTALGLSKLALGANDSAIAEMKTAVYLDTQSTKPDVMLVLTHLRLKEYDQALATAKKIIEKQSDDPLGHNLAGAAYLGKKDAANARASFEKAVSVQPAYFPAVINLVRLDQQDNKPDVAKKRLESYLDKDKKNLQAMAALADIAQAQGQTNEVTAWLEKANNENPNSIQAARMLITQYLRIGEKQKALVLAQKTQGSNPENPDVLDILAQTQFSIGDKLAALETYNKLASIKPDSAFAQYRIASIHMAMQNNTAATAALNKSLSLQPDYLDAQLALAILEIRQGNNDSALTIAKQVQQKHSREPVGYALEGDILMSQKKTTLAVKAYEQAFSLGKSGPLMIKLYPALNQAGKGKEADDRLNQWLKDHPDDFATRMYFASANLSKNQNKVAIEQLQTVLQKDPKNAAALNDLAWAYQKEKDPRALQYAEEANRLLPDNASVMDTLGWILVEQGNISRGLPLLEKANSLSSDLAEIQYHFAVALFKSGNKSKARKELEQLLASGKNFDRIEEARALLKRL